jgi:hypothetical protein
MSLARAPEEEEAAATQRSAAQTSATIWKSHSKTQPQE